MREKVITTQTIADPKTSYGDGKAASRHFIAQRWTGAVNVLLVGFLVWMVVRLAGADRAEMISVVGNPIAGIILAVLLVVALVHMRIGMVEIVEDYVQDPRTNRLSLMLNTLFCLGVGLIGVIAILKLVIWG
ncbi:succinate dehydrogenase, hydrophobic membrane anchor protein [Devosia rhodophyticola]|uniref:Succinate dehydrogenase hydrophobic membrane anchor subunit n=1 Tax=Devosia rhodophyticola TaxID=3026423 RepID=A0ABY7YTC2_9HYPH|nr:succinate dehydrogenase, hydrophobic membrane anchor protein [Devosia rhodophyticola]WDR04457.1 succinate dehydrogenase, hydrophobic membrane anchor protein [Devosia rhodophyticola]